MPNSLGFKKRDMNKENSNVNGFDFAHHCPEQRRTDKCQMSNLVLILIFLIWKTFDTWVLFFAAKIIPYLGFFPYPKELFDFGLPQVSSALANFDGIHYLKIACCGYAQWEQAFFPLYPLLIKCLTFVFNNGLTAGLIISNVSFLIGLWIFTKYLRLISTNSNQFQLILTILLFPTSFFFGAVYTEGLFFLLFVLTLYFLKKDLPAGRQENIYLATFFAILTSLTRLVGVFLIIPIIFHYLSLRVKRSNLNKEIASSSSTPRDDRKILNTKYFILILSPLIGLGIYCFYLWQTTGDPFFFFTSQPFFGANRSTRLILLPQVIWRYIKIFVTASHNFQYYVSVFEFLIFSFVFTVLIFDLFHLLMSFRARNLSISLRVNSVTSRGILKKDPSTRPASLDLVGMTTWDRLGLNLFSLANILFPTLTGTLLSIPRFTLLSLSMFIFLAEIKNKWIKIVVVVIFFILHIVVLGFFGQGYFIS